MLRFRLNPSPTHALPLNVRSAGHYQFAAHHHEVRDAGAFLQVFWSVAGSGRFKAGGASHALKPGGVFYYASGEPHDLVAGPDGWEYRWLTFDGPRLKTIVHDHHLSRVQTAGPCPIELFEQLDTALLNPTFEGETRASILGYEILLRAAAPQPARAQPSDDAQAENAAAAKAWLDTHFTDARVNVASLTARLRLHRSSLHRLFIRHHGIAPVQYLGRLRLRLALELLTDTRLPVADVAVRCGLPDLSYFAKLVARHTGYSPRDYRQRHAHTGGLPTGAKPSD